VSGGKAAVVLSGGGANGAYAVGVLKALASGRSPATGGRPLEPQIFAGTSIGSYNAAFLVSQWDEYGGAAVANLERTWIEGIAENPDGCGNGGVRYRLDPFELLDPRCYLPNPFGPLARAATDSAALGWDGLQRLVHAATDHDARLETRLLELVDFASFVSREPFEGTLRQTLDFSDIRASSRQLLVAATNWATGQLRIFGNRDMTDERGVQVLMASSAIPGIFPVAAVGAEPYVDGGVLQNTPLSPAIRAGAHELHVVFLDPAVSAIPLSHLQNTVQSLYRMQEIAWAAAVNDDIRDARSINEALEILAGVDESQDPESPLGRFYERYRRFQRITVHSYHPREDLGGAASLFDLRRERLAGLIERGFDDTVHHDCQESGCVLAGAPPEEAP
jgi:NTE family protein